MTISTLSPAPIFNRRPFTAEEFVRLAETGFFGESDRLELIEGEIVRMSPIGDIHGAVVRWLTRILTDAAIRDRASVAVQGSIVLSKHSQPQPDVCLLANEAFRLPRHPKAADVLLVIEVSDSTLRIDREAKLPLYARAGIREYWIVNLQDNVLEVHREPDSQSGRYLQDCVVNKGESIAPLAFPDFQTSVSEVLP